MNSKEMVKPIEKLVGLYKKYNNSCLDVDHLICGGCNAWLSPPIYLVEGGRNVCAKCSNEEKYEHCLHNPGLEKLLSYGKYPCKYSVTGCNYFGTSIELHESTCDYNILCFCQQTMESKAALLQHLQTNHSMKEMHLTKPVVEIAMEAEECKERNFLLYSLKVGDTALILLLLPNIASGEISIMIYDASGVQRELEYMLKLTYNNAEYNRYGRVMFKFYVSGELKNKLYIPNLNMITKYPLTFKVYFANYQHIEPFCDFFQSILKESECPVCLVTIRNSWHQCPNGHNVCPSCKKQMTACPMCRQPLSETIMRAGTMSLTDKFYRPCNYADGGCFLYEQDGKMLEHERDCKMKPIACTSCTGSKFNKTTFIAHMLVHHNMQKMEASSAVVQPGFILFNSKVFKLGFKNTVDPADPAECSWFFQLVYSPEQTTSYDFKLEITIDGEVFTIISKTQTDEEYQYFSTNAETKYSPVLFTLTL